MSRAVGVVAFALLCASGCPGANPGGEGEDAGPSIEPTLSSIHDNIFHVSCSAAVCHGGSGPVDNMNLDLNPFADLVGVDSAEIPSLKRVVAGDPENSLLFKALNGPVDVDTGHVDQMPQLVSEGLPQSARDAIKAWIAAGALDN